MGALCDRMTQDLQLRGRRESTIDAYVSSARDFVRYHRRPPTELGADHAPVCLLQLRDERGLTQTTINVRVCPRCGECAVVRLPLPEHGAPSSPDTS